MQGLDGLNAQQRHAVGSQEKTLLIAAGPGTGKTKTLVFRIAYLLESGLAKSTQITALTFTKKATEEMRQRLKELLSGNPLPDVTTFHGLCYQLLTNQSEKLPQIVDEAERMRIIKTIRKNNYLNDMTSREVASQISLVKSNYTHSFSDRNINKLVKDYNSVLASKGLCDYDDILQDAYKLLAQNRRLLEQTKSRCRHLLIDEFQDTNNIQYELLRLLGTNNLFLIGDAKQSIYGFRGASGDIVERFREDFPAHKTITLTINYRSTPAIVALANAVFADEPSLSAQNHMQGKARAVEVLNEYSEADWIINEIEHHIGGSDMLRGHEVDSTRQRTTRFKNYAVLYRTHRLSKTLQKKLAQSGIPYQVVGDGSPYEKEPVKTIIDILRLLNGDEVAESNLVSAQQRKALLKVLELRRREPLTKLVAVITKTLGLEDSEANHDISQFMSTLIRFDKKNLGKYLTYIDDISESGFYDEKADCVTLLSVHAAKGLEFDHVFLLATEEGLLPFDSKSTDITEEKRLFYVAITRPRQYMDILYAKRRGGKSKQPSRFIAGQSEEVLAREVDGQMDAQIKRIKKRQLKRSQTKLL